MENEFDNTPTAPKSGRTAPAAVTPIVALVLSVAACLIAGGAWLDANRAKNDLTQLFGGKLAELDKSNKDVAIRNESLLRDLRDAQNRVVQLEVKLAEFQNQRVAIEEMTRDLARAPEDWLLAEIEQTLNIASRELILAGNIRAAISALQTADQRLSRADKLQAAPLRRAITQDLERLKAIPAVDTQGIVLKLDNLSALAATLPLAVPASMKDLEGQRAGGADEGRSDLPWWRQMWRDFTHEISDLVRIRELESTEAMLITPQQALFVRENLKLRLLSARTSLLARDETNFRDDLKAARELVGKYFDPKAKVNQNVVASLKQLADNAVAIAVPDIVQSMNAVRTARAARERPGR
jgi:uncharacterized protein HemX